MLVADRHQHLLVLAVLVGLVAQADGGGLATPLQLVREECGIKVEDLHCRAAPYPLDCIRNRAAATISRSPGYVSFCAASSSAIHEASSISSSWSAGSPAMYSSR